MPVIETIVSTELDLAAFQNTDTFEKDAIQSFPPLEAAPQGLQETDSEDSDSDELSTLSLGESALATYWNEGRLSALASAVSAFRAALCQGLMEGREEKIRAQIGLADALRLEVEEGTGSDETRAEALALAEAANAGAASSSSALYAESTRALAELLLDRTRHPEPDRLQRAVDMFCQLVALTSDAPPDIAIHSLALYAQSLNGQATEKGDSKLSDLANSVVDRAMGIGGGRIAQYPELGFAFMMARWKRSKYTGSIEDLDQAIEMGETLVSNCPPGYPRLAKFWNALGVLYHAKATSAGDAGDYRERELQAYSEARKRVHPNHGLWHMYNGNFASALSDRFVTHSNLEDLKEATEITRSVVSRTTATGYTHLYGPGYVLNLSELLPVCYAQFGNLDALDEAVALQLDIRERMASVFAQNTLTRLGSTYYTRYTAYGRMADLETAIAMQEQALSHSTGPYGHFVEVSHELAECLLARFDQCGEPIDLERATSVLRGAVDHPQQHFKGSVYSLLGQALLQQGIMSRNPEDIDESILCQQKALDLFPQTHSQRCISYHRLGLAEHRSFMTRPQPAAIQNSVFAYRHALAIMPQDHPNRAAYISDLATSQLATVDAAHSEELTAVLKVLREAATHLQSWPADRYTAAALWARTAHRYGRLESALEGYHSAISLLPQVAWLGLEDELRLQRLSRQPQDISQDAAACAIELGRYDIAVEMIEASRSILWNTSQELRAELGKLRDAEPALAQELAQTNAALAFRPGLTRPHQEESSRESERRRIHRLATRRTELLDRIRSLAGFEQFLRPASYDVLRHVSRHGPVVILVTSTYRCDALLLRADTHVTLVSLPDVTHNLVLDQVQLLQSSLQSARDCKGHQFLNRALLTILRRLWEHIGKPIWASLRQVCTSPLLPRIWWCPTGAMTALPLHACGPYNGVDPNMNDLVVSSYTPTLSALLRPQNKTASAAPRPRVLVIVQPETPNHAPLPCALDEARVLHSLLPSLCTFLVGAQGTVAQVRDLLPRHSWVHISSHGTQNIQNPLSSSIALHDGDLRLSDLAHARIPYAEFAFLSACHSAKGAQALPDEAMHLAAGMMFAGFRSVVATAWAIADRDVPGVAKAFYARLGRDGRGMMVVEDTAEALHFAVKRLRESGVPMYRWIPFIHLGA